MYKLALVPIAVLVTSALPAAAAPGCDAVITATLKVLQVPAHLYMTETAGVLNGKTRNAETIYLNGTTFVMTRGRWVKGNISPKDLLEAKKESEQKNGICTMVRVEGVNGEAATLYKVHNQTADDTVDTQI